MRADNSFLLSFKKLAVLLLPTMLRKDVISTLVQLFVSPIGFIHVNLLKYRIESNYRLTHNGQVCYLQAVINDKFDPIERRIKIKDAEAKEPKLIYWREEERLAGVPVRDVGALIIAARGYSGTDGYDFVIQVPVEYYVDSFIQQIRALTNQYKLASKQFDITTLE